MRGREGTCVDGLRATGGRKSNHADGDYLIRNKVIGTALELGACMRLVLSSSHRPEGLRLDWVPTGSISFILGLSTSLLLITFLSGLDKRVSTDAYAEAVHVHEKLLAFDELEQ